MRAWTDPPSRTSSAILELPRTPRRKRGPLQRLVRFFRRLAEHRWDLAYLAVPAIPSLTLGVLLYARYWELAHPRDFLARGLDFFYALLVANALVGLGLAVWAYFLFTERRELVDEVATRRSREEERREALERLQKEMELLTAMRDLSRIINDDVQFEAVWKQVLEVLGSLVQCRKITIFSVDDSGRPVPRILHQRSKTAFGAAIPAEEVDLTNVPETLHHRSILRLAEGESLFWTYPLMADGEALGVLQITTGLGGNHEEKIKRIEQYEDTICHLLKHISLALKTPTLYDRAVLDGLTGLYTKRHFSNQIGQLFRISLRQSDRPFSLVISDLDFFKSVNDTHGHVAGDRCLQAVARTIKEQARTSDLVFRYGGEEMCLLLPDTAREAAAIVAERIHQAIRETKVSLPDGQALSVTASMGVAQFDPEMKRPDELVMAADQALYRAKEAGRNQVWQWTAGELSPTPKSPRGKIKKPPGAR